MQTYLIYERNFKLNDELVHIKMIKKSPYTPGSAVRAVGVAGASYVYELKLFKNKM